MKISRTLPRLVYIIIACMFSGTLAAETIGNVEFQFPPSTYDWVLLTDSNSYFPLEESSADAFEIKIYTHKAGDALEFFSVMSIVDKEKEEETDENFQTAEFAQLFINDLLKAYFPNHRVAITSLTETKDDGFLEWELSDGVQQILHGLCRYLKTKENDIFFNYMTTASKSSENSALWKDTLYQAKPLHLSQ